MKKSVKKCLALVLAVIMLMSLLTVGASAATTSGTFTDIAGSSHAHAIQELVKAGILKGVSATRFDPDGTVTRAMAVTVLGRMANAEEKISTAFTDVDNSSWYAGYVGWAVENGIVVGVGGGRFNPESPITGQELDLMLARYAALTGISYEAANTSTATITRGELAEMVFYVYTLLCLSNTADPADSEGYVTPKFAQTTGGWLMGYQEDSTYIFKGIQYGVVNERFKPAQPASWPGVRAALVYAETANNPDNNVSLSSFVDAMGPDMVQNEQCLYLNVWTQSMDNTANKPVIFFIHGGGYSSGASNELNVYDGKALSEFGDVVYVNVNHRLNYLGYTDLSYYGDEYAESGNVGQSDLVLALQWVHDNIATFGGDPGNVTIVGQSGGGGKVRALLGTPSAENLFQKAVQLSGGAGGLMGETDHAIAQAAGQALVEKCKANYDDVTTDAEALEKLRNISYSELAELASGTGVGSGPVYGTDFWPELTYNPDTGEFCELAKDKPLIVSSTFGELNGADGRLVIPMLINMFGSFAFNPSDPDAFLADYFKPKMTEEKMIELVTTKYGENTEKVMELFAKAYPDRDIVDVLSFVNRNDTVKYVADKAAQGGAPVYNCVFSYEYPAMGGIMNYHTGGDMTLWMRNVENVGITTKGDKAGAWAVSEVASTALVNFARTGNPSSELLDWTPYTAETGATAQFDDHCRVANNPDRELLDYLGSIGALLSPFPFG